MAEIRTFRRDLQFERLLADAFRRAGWKVVRRPDGDRPHAPDLIVRKGPRTYAVKLKSAPEGRRDRLIPLLSQAILEAQVAARNSHSSAAPLAVVAAARVAESLAKDVRLFAADLAADVAVGVMDLEGLRQFLGPGLEDLNARSRRGDREPLSKPEPSLHLFSDLNQWMLKVLLAPRVPEKFLRAPRGEYRNASELAEAAGVSVMSAFRLVRQLRNEGFLDESADCLRLVRIEDLMWRWQAANNLQPAREVALRWTLKGDARRLHDALRSYAQDLERGAPAAARRTNQRESAGLRICLSLFAAADIFGVGFVHGAPSHVYFEQPRREIIRQLGLSIIEPGRPVDVYLRVPQVRESVFRAAVRRNAVPVSDILQVWLDVAGHPARGQAQAEEIRHGILRPLFLEKWR